MTWNMITKMVQWSYKEISLIIWHYSFGGYVGSNATGIETE